MKRVLLMSLAVAVACSGMAFAQNFGVNPGSGGPNVFAPCVLGPDDITQSLDCSIEVFTGIACAAGGVTTDTSYPRRFFLNADHAISGAYTVDAVQFGVEVDAPESGGACDGNPVTVNCYSIANGASFLYSNMNLLDSASVNLGGTTGGTIVTVPMNGTCTIGDPVGEDLVVEFVSCDHLNDGQGFGQFFPGANSLGETQPSYIAADDCAITDPITLDSIGFVANDTVMVVEGTEGGAGCQGAFKGNPRVRRRASGVTIDFRLDLTHRRGQVVVPIYAELHDRAGNVVAGKDLGLFTLGLGDTVSVRDILRAPAGLESGAYTLVARIPRMKNLLEFKKLIMVP